MFDVVRLEGPAEGDGGLSVAARGLLKFSTPRDPAQLAAFISLHVLNPEHAHWRRGIEAAALYARIHGDLKVPFIYPVPPPPTTRRRRPRGGRPLSPVCR
ncbi:hypothetical protein [Streptomyces sp. SudanB91_2054]|uniref:hypothetical protein n=1 Tax=Streptomyces sp. SudanB91_2054 TaxID=3035278 RepID=UPI0036DD38C7